MFNLQSEIEKETERWKREQISYWRDEVARLNKGMREDIPLTTEEIPHSLLKERK